MPVFDQAAKLGNHPELFELPQSLDGQYTGLVQGILLSFGLNPFLPVDGLVGDGRALSSREINKVPGLPTLPPAKFQDFPIDHGDALHPHQCPTDRWQACRRSLET